jgi:hypothetical protein
VFCFGHDCLWFPQDIDTNAVKVSKFCSHPIDSLRSYCPRLGSTGQDSRSSNPQAEQPLALVFVVVLLSCAQNIVTSCHIGLHPILVSPFQISVLCAHKHSIRFQCHPSAESAPHLNHYTITVTI